MLLSCVDMIWIDMEEGVARVGDLGGKNIEGNVGECLSTTEENKN